MIPNLSHLPVSSLRSKAICLIEAMLEFRPVISLMENGGLPIKRVKKVEKRDGYEIRTEIIDDSQWGGSGNLEMVSCYNPNGDYIGDVRDAEYLVTKMGILPELSTPNHGVCSVGYCPKKEKWAGWSHRALCFFGIGDKVFEEDFGDDQTLFVEHGSVTIKNMAQAREAAVNFARFVN